MVTKMLGNRRVVLPVACGALASLVVVMVWIIMTGEPAPRVFATIDMPVYSKVETLSAASDLVVKGIVNRVVAREVDYGTSNPAERHGPGMPTVFYEVDVVETLLGEAGKTIIVAAPDSEKIIIPDQSTPLQAGQEVLLFLASEDGAPGLKPFDQFYVTVSLDNGVFDVLANDAVQPRMPEVFTGTMDGTGGSPTYSLSEVSQKVQSAQK
jgi:hypothetical protein